MASKNDCKWPDCKTLKPISAWRGKECTNCYNLRRRVTKPSGTPTPTVVSPPVTMEPVSAPRLAPVLNLVLPVAASPPKALPQKVLETSDLRDQFQQAMDAMRTEMRAEMGSALVVLKAQLKTELEIQFHREIDRQREVAQLRENALQLKVEALIKENVALSAQVLNNDYKLRSELKDQVNALDIRQEELRLRDEALTFGLTRQRNDIDALGVRGSMDSMLATLEAESLGATLETHGATVSDLHAVATRVVPIVNRLELQADRVEGEVKDLVSVVTSVVPAVNDLRVGIALAFPVINTLAEHVSVLVEHGHSIDPHVAMIPVVIDHLRGR